MTATISPGERSDGGQAASLPIYCINQAAQVERRERMRRRFEHFGLLERVRFVRAVEKDSSLVARCRTPAGPLREVQPAMLAAVLTHLRALRTFLRETPASVEGALVFEDDARLHHDWHRLLDAVLANLPDDTPACALGYSDEDWDLPPELWQGFAWAGRVPERHNLVGFLARRFQSHAYWVSRAHARGILREFRADPSRFTVPEAISKVPGSLAAFPSLAVQDGSVSTVTPGLRWAAVKPVDLAWEPQDYHSEDGTTLIAKRTGNAPTVALCAIAWNDAHLVERWARSLTGLIDSWVVCDTGSTDATPDAVDRAFSGLPGRLYRDQWVNQGFNRSLMLERARGVADYLLLLDPRYGVRLRYQLGRLDADAYSPLVLEAVGGWQPVLVRGAQPWQATGIGLGSLVGGDGSAKRLDHLVVRSNEDEASRSARLRRDLEAVDRALAEGPGVADLVSEAAELCRQLGEDARAVDLYRRRRGLGGDRAQVFEAMFRYGELVGRSDWDRAVNLLLDTWEAFPERAEPLWCLARGYRLRGQHAVAARFAEEGLEIAAPPDLAPEFRPVYDWKLAFEWSLALYGSGDPAEAAAVAWPLLELRSVDDTARVEIQDHVQRSVDAAWRRRHEARSSIVPLQVLVPTTMIGRLRFDLDPAVVASSPSIARDGDRLRAVVQLRDPDLGSTPAFADLVLDPDLSVTDGRILSDAHLGAEGPTLDFRETQLVRLAGDWWMLGYPRSPLDAGAVLLRLADGGFADHAIVQHRPEANLFAPLVADGQLLFLSGFPPLTVLRVDLSTGDTLSETATGRFPGGDGDQPASPGVRVDDGTLFLSRKSTDVGTTEHRFVLLDDRLEVVGASDAFCFLSPAGERCSGLALLGEDLVACFEQTDPPELYLVRLPYRDLAAIL